MRFNSFGFSTYVGLGVVIFVALIGALGYTYVMNYKAEVATATSSSKTIAAETAKAPEVNKTSDLNAAADTVDNVSVDSLSEADMASLDVELNSL